MFSIKSVQSLAIFKTNKFDNTFTIVKETNLMNFLHFNSSTHTFVKAVDHVFNTEDMPTIQKCSCCGKTMIQERRNNHKGENLITCPNGVYLEYRCVECDHSYSLEHAFHQIILKTFKGDK